MGVLEDTDWSKLLHAYGRATDTPEALRALLSGDRGQQDGALHHLWGAINHQGTVYPATGPVAQFVADHLRDTAIDPLLEPLLGFIASIVGAVIGLNRAELAQAAKPDITPLLQADEDDDVWGDAELADSMCARGLLGVFERLDGLVRPVVAMLDHKRSTVRTGASQTAAYLAKAGAKLDASALAKSVRKLAAAADVDERCAHVMALGSLGEETADFLDDASAAVRTCAALNKGNANSERGTKELLRALEHDDIDAWFRERPPQFSMKPRFCVIGALVQRVKDFDRLVDAAVHVAKTTSRSVVDYEWGRLLAAAFPDGQGKIMTDAQRRYLAALVENAELWDPRFGNAQRWFRQAGLPLDRAKCEALVRAAKS